MRGGINTFKCMVNRFDAEIDVTNDDSRVGDVEGAEVVDEGIDRSRGSLG